MLRRCSPPSVRTRLNELPETLDGAYEHILMEIKKPDREHAHRLLQCLVVAIRPLRIEELAEVLAVDFDAEGAIPRLNKNWRRADPDEAVLSTCSSLVSIVNIHGSRVVQFSHPSVKEFLTSDRLAESSGPLSSFHISLEPAHTILAQACLGVLLRLEDNLDRDGIEDLPLADYAAKHWVDHARFENVASHIKEAMELLFDPDKPHFTNWVWIYDMDEPSGSPTRHAIRSNATPLYYSALCGLPSLTEQLIVERDMDVNARGGHYGTAIRAALYKRHLSIVHLLIEHGVDVNFRDDDGSSLLHMAAQTGDPEAASNSENLAVTRLLLDHGADANARDKTGFTALHISSDNGDFELIRVLLDYGAVVDSQDNHSFTPLHLASAKGNDSVVRLLIEHGADVNALADKSTPLHSASLNGNLEVVKLLMGYGADLIARDSKNSTPLHLASAKGNKTVVGLLIEYGAEVNALDNTNSTPLHLALLDGNLDAVILLIERGADVTARDNKNSTPLHLASAKGNEKVVRSLIEHRAEVNALDNTNSTPLHLALLDGNLDIVVPLIECGADVTARDNKNSTPLHLASAKGNETIVKLLIESGGDVNVKDEKGMTPLHAASRREHFDVVKLLLEYGAEPNARNDEGQTPLHIASREGFTDTVKCLLSAGADANARDCDGKIPQDVASTNKKLEVVQLLTKPARPNVRENRRRSSQLQAVGLPRQTIGSPRRQSVTTRERRAGQ